MNILSTSIIALGLISGGAQAATVFSEDFNNDSATSFLSFTAFDQFTVSDGTVDYIRSGDFGIACVGGTGGCVDLDGSTRDAGVMTSTAFAITAGRSYSVSFDLSGNQRGYGSDTVNFGITGGQFLSSLTVDPLTPFATITNSFTATMTGFVSFFIGNTGGDNVGAILDNVAVNSIEMPAVPLPATLPLLAGALGAVSFLRRRRKS